MIAEVLIVAIAAVLWHALSLYADYRKRDLLAFERYAEERKALDGKHRGELESVSSRMRSLESRMEGLELRGAFR